MMLGIALKSSLIAFLSDESNVSIGLLGSDAVPQEQSNSMLNGHLVLAHVDPRSIDGARPNFKFSKLLVARGDSPLERHGVSSGSIAHVDLIGINYKKKMIWNNSQTSLSFYVINNRVPNRLAIAHHH